MTTLHIKTIGNGQPLIFLHGWGWHSAIWQPLIPLLAADFQLWLIDLPGFGKSPVLTNDYTIENIATQLLANVPEKSAWLGWSLGGVIASFIAVHYPNQISHLITVASSPKFVRDTNWPGVDKETLEKFSELLITSHKKTLSDFLELQLRGSPKKEELFLQLQHTFFRENLTELPALFGGLALLQNTDLRNQLISIQCPQLHIFGGLDTLVPTTVAALVPDFAPQARCEIIKRTGHMPFLTHPEIFIDLVNQFLR